MKRHDIIGADGTYVGSVEGSTRELLAPVLGNTWYDDKQPFTGPEAVAWLVFRDDAAQAVTIRLPRDRDEARRVVAAVGCYNRFDPAEAWRIVDGWFSYITSVELERSHGVVLTFTLCRNAPEYVLADMTQLVGELADVEATIDTNLTARTVRAWWD